MVKKLNPLSVQEKLSGHNLIIFTPREFQRLFNVSSFAASKFINQYSRKNFFIKLRNGLYSLSAAKPGRFIIANKLYQPSYISLETALAFYNIIPETVYSITSVSTKATRSFIAASQEFSFSKIKKKLFTGYQLLEKGGERFLIAEPEKALLDYFYLASLKKEEINDRINISGLNKNKIKEWQKLFNNAGVNGLISKFYADERTN